MHLDASRNCNGDDRIAIQLAGVVSPAF